MNKKVIIWVIIAILLIIACILGYRGGKDWSAVIDSVSP